ncbi:MAG: hypothetical protein P8X91_01605 [Candidatus Bathyarchaeota archaeon]
MRNIKNKEFLLSTILLLITIIFSAIAYIFWLDLSFFVGPFFFIHWLGIIAAVFVALLIPIYYGLKRKRSQNRKILLRIHVFGNLVAFLLISIHFAQNLGRLINYFPKIEDGIALYLVLAILVVTGFLEKFRIGKKVLKYTKFVHRYIIVVFYAVVTIHMLQGFNIIQ